MVTLKITANYIRRTLKSFIILPLLLAGPVFQLYLMHAVAGSISAGKEVGSMGKSVELVLLGQVSNVDLMQTAAASSLVYFLLIAGIAATAMGVSDRSGNTLMRVFTTPVRRIQVAAGNLLAQAVIASLVAVFVIPYTYFVYGVNWGNNIPGIITITLVFIFVSVAFGFAFSGLFRNTKVAVGITAFIVFVSSFLSGGMTLSGDLGLISKFTISKWAVDTYSNLMQGLPLSGSVKNILLLGAIGAAFAVIGWITYRRESVYE